jgi:hypothetical protein
VSGLPVQDQGRMIVDAGLEVKARALNNSDNNCRAHPIEVN